MKLYKGFNADMTCRGYKFEEGKTYEAEGELMLCHTGFHACEAPLDCFGYYSPASSVYHEVELDATDARCDDDTKRVGKKITIGAKLDIAGICKAQTDYVKEHCTNENNAAAGKPATAGDYGAATAGDSGAATAGYSGAATAGDRGAATAGDSGAATAGYSGAATAGDYGAATAGGNGAATAGYRGAATAGDYGAATSRGGATVGENGVATVRGNNVRARGGTGAVLVIAEENESNWDIKYLKAIVIDGKRYKPDTWYKLDENGEVIEE